MSHREHCLLEQLLLRVEIKNIRFVKNEKHLHNRGPIVGRVCGRCEVDSAERGVGN